MSSKKEIKGKEDITTVCYGHVDKWDDRVEDAEKYIKKEKHGRLHE